MDHCPTPFSRASMANEWYFISYRMPDILLSKWTEQTYDLNALLISKLQNVFGCDLSKGFIGSMVCGVEGYAEEGLMSAEWATIKYEQCNP